MTSHSDQEAFWRGEFGDEYIERNRLDDSRLSSRLNMWSKIISFMPGKIRSVLEIGPNIGLNLRALRALLPEARLHGVEINEKAADALRAWGEVSVHTGSIIDYAPPCVFDLVFTAGVLIHIDPEKLPVVYDKMKSFSSRYIVVAEYYNPTPVEVRYRGHSNKLFKRDFAGEMLDAFPELALRGYGFGYHRDPHFPIDDTTWFVMEKSAL